MAEKSVGRRATRRRSIETGRILALGGIVNGSSADGVLASDRSGSDEILRVAWIVRRASTTWASH
jgi:hypothetical protein